MKKYRIVELANGLFVIQEKILFFWTDSYTLLGDRREFNSEEQALHVYDVWLKNNESIKRIVKELE